MEQTMEFASLIFFLMVFFFIYGGGRFSVDHWIQKK